MNGKLIEGLIIDSLMDLLISRLIKLQILVTRKRTITPEMILFLVTGLMRMTMVPMYSILTTPYIDNHVPHGQSAVFITYFRIVVSIGPVSDHGRLNSWVGLKGNYRRDK